MSVTHVIPCLNHHDITYKCLDFLEKNTNDVGQVIIVDDGSDEPFRNKHDSVITVIRHETNRGFPKSVNDGIKLSTSEYVAVWNNDLFVAPNWLPPLITALENDDDLGMASAMLLEPKDTTEEDFFSKYTEQWSLSGTPEVLYWYKGCPWVFKSSTFDKIGLFDERFYPTQYEDSDFLLRMAIQKIKHATVSNSVAYHLASYTQNSVLKEMFDGFQYAADNRKKFEDKWGTYHIDYQRTYRTGEV